MPRYLFVLLVFSALLLPGFYVVQVNNKFYKLTANKELTMPQAADYRQWKFVGSAVIPDDKNGGKAIFPGIHQVYIDPDSYRHRLEKGKFPDGTILVMEVSRLKLRESEAGFGYFSTGGQDLLVSIKDRRTFDDSPTGWAYYLFSDSDIKNGKTIKPRADSRCQSCHQIAAEDDEVFTQYYQALRWVEKK